MENTRDDAIQIDLGQGLEALWHKKYLIIAVTIFFTCIGFLFTYFYPNSNSYVAESTVYSMAKAYDTSVDPTLDTTVELETYYGAQALIGYANIATSNTILEQVIASLDGEYDLDIDDLKKMTTASMVDTTVMEITVTSSDPNMSVVLDNAITEAFVSYINNVTQDDAIQILDSATDVTASNKIWVIRILFFLLGFFITVVPILVFELFFPQLRTVAQCEIDGEHSYILGIMPNI